MITFNSICGVPIHYDRDSHAAYGTRGRPIKIGGPVTPDFWMALQGWMADLGELCPWGRPELLCTGGIRGAGTDPDNRHTQGRAIDIDAIWWHGRSPLITLHAPQQAPLYLAVEATLRGRFGVVLDWWYNAAHQDHWHVDDGQEPGWRAASRSRAVWLQAALTHIWGRPTAIDGTAGPRTLDAAGEVLEGLGTTEPLARSWPTLLRATARRGFGLVT